MASVKLPKVNARLWVKGKSAKELMNIPKADFLVLPSNVQREIVSRLSSAANKRVINLAKKNIPINLKSYERGKFSVAGKNKKQVVGEYNRVKDFLSKKTTTLSGIKSIAKKLSSIAPDFPTKLIEDVEKRQKYEESYNERLQRVLDTFKAEYEDYVKASGEPSFNDYLVEKGKVSVGDLWEMVDELSQEHHDKNGNQHFRYEVYVVINEYANKEGISNIEEYYETSEQKRNILEELIDNSKTNYYLNRKQRK